MRSRSALLALTCAALFATGVARADGSLAEALFYEARSLMKEGRYPAACAKLTMSLRLEYGIGTEFNLADCNERLGRVSTAFAAFLHVASAAKEHQQPDREEVALERARALEARVPRVVLDVPASAPSTLDVTCDGVTVDASSWGRPLPFDPGLHRVVASAVGRTPWEAAFDLAEGAVFHVAIPPDLGGPDASKEPASAPAQAHRDEDATGRLQRTVGWTAGVVGLAGIAVGMGYGLDSLHAGASSRAHCAGDRCDARGVVLREHAIRSGDAATIVSIAGAAALIGGITVVLTAPRAPRPALRASARPIGGGGGLFLEGALP
jgi:serine/threonine-protein kinase